jgi:outer membrane biosynthesis protein TonB
MGAPAAFAIVLVTDVKVLQTTGSGLLDDRIVDTFRRWRFGA